MSRRRTPVITTADNGSKFVGEFSRERGRPKRERNPRGGQFRKRRRDLKVYWFRHYAGLGWENIADKFERDPDVVNPADADALRKAADRLERRIIPLAPNVAGAVYGLSNDELEFAKRHAHERLHERLSRKRLMNYKPRR